MSIAIGIDLGTTNSVAARMRKAESKVVDNRDDQPLTPSVVHITKQGEHLVGKLAKAEGGSAPEHTVFSIKRFIGREFTDPAIQGDIQHAPFKVAKAANGEVEVILRDQPYSPIEISSFILEAIKQDVEAASDDEVTHAVITVPAYFGNRQKEATREAGQRAGLHVMRIIPEPTAAALAYGFDSEKDESKTILVYDLGGGTFDVTVMFIGAGVFDDQGKTGDMHLGGDDFDHKIMDWLVEQTYIQHRVDLRNLPNSSEILFNLKQAAEGAKIKLSRTTRAQIVVPGLMRAGGRLIDVECELTRDQFNRMIQPDVDRSIELVHEAIRKANVTLDEINAVLLVGGSTRIPLVVESLQHVFGERVIQGNVNPMHCVAQGAAIQTLIPSQEVAPPIASQAAPQVSARPSTPPSLPDIECVHCGARNTAGSTICRTCGKPPTPAVSVYQKIPVPIGIEVEGGALEIILDDTMYFPTEKNKPVTRMFKTSRPGMERVRMPVYEGRDSIAQSPKNQYLGAAQGQLPPALPQGTNVAVSFSIDEDGILFVTASLPNQPGVKIEASMAWKATVREPTTPTTSLPEITWREQAQSALIQLRLITNESTGLIPPNLLTPLAQIGGQLEQALMFGDERNGQALLNQLEPLLENLGMFSMLGLARHLAQDPDFASKSGLERADQLSRAVARADLLKQQRDPSGMARVVGEEIMPALNEMIATSGMDLGDLLARSG